MVQNSETTKDRALHLISSIFYYGNFVPETYNERKLEQCLNELGLWPTTEDEIIERSRKLFPEQFS